MSEIPKYIGPNHQLPEPDPENYPINVTGKFASLGPRPTLADELFNDNELKKHDPFIQLAKIALVLIKYTNVPLNEIILRVGDAPRVQEKQPKLDLVDLEALMEFLTSLRSLNMKKHKGPKKLGLDKLFNIDNKNNKKNYVLCIIN